jgi:hypothetical protein
VAALLRLTRATISLRASHASLAALARKLGYSGHLQEREQVLPGNTR